MALIYCPECKKEISNKSTVCINCGCPMTESSMQNDLKNDNMVTENVVPDKPDSHTKKKKILRRCLLTIVILFTIILGYEAIKINKYDNFKGSIQAIQCCKKLMKDPNSFKLEDDIIHVKYKSTQRFSDGTPYEVETDYYLINYSGTNSYNARVTNQSMLEGLDSAAIYLGEYCDSSSYTMSQAYEAEVVLSQRKSHSHNKSILVYEIIDKDSYNYLLTRLFYRH